MLHINSKHSRQNRIFALYFFGEYLQEQQQHRNTLYFMDVLKKFIISVTQRKNSYLLNFMY